MKRLFVVFCLLLLTLSSSLLVSAQEDLRISATIIDDTTYIDYIFRLNSNYESLSLEVPSNSNIIYLKDDFGDLNYELNTEASRLEINFENEIVGDESRLVLLKLKTKDLVSEKTSHNEFVYNIRGLENYKLSLNLPDNLVLDSVESTPEGVLKIYSDSNSLEWDLEGDEVILVKYQREGQNNYLWVIVGLISVVLISLFLYFRRKKISKKEVLREKGEVNVEKDDGNEVDNSLDSESKDESKEKLLESLNLLNEKDKAVVEYVIKNEGCLQSNLQKEIGYTKSNLSKIIKKLEFRGVLKVKKIGKINRLYLGEKFR